MKFFQHFFGKPKKDRRFISDEEIDQAQRTEASVQYRQTIYRKYYSDYPEKPYISRDRELNTSWLVQENMFAGSLVEKRMMIRYRDGLLPGHVYMLYWLGRYNSNRRIPAYFEYEYGLDFIKEKQFLFENGYLDSNDKPTDAGKKAIEHHKNVIDERHPAPKKVGTPTTSLLQQKNSKRVIPNQTEYVKTNIPNSDFPLLKEEMSYINDVLRYACELAEITVPLFIDVSRFIFGLSMWETHYEWNPYTNSGKASKYPLMLRYVYDDKHNPVPPNECFGELYYLQKGIIGKARLIFWKEHVGYFIYLGQTNNLLVIKRIEKSTPPDRMVLYKE